MNAGHASHTGHIAPQARTMTGRFQAGDSVSDALRETRHLAMLALMTSLVQHGCVHFGLSLADATAVVEELMEDTPADCPLPQLFEAYRSAAAAVIPL